jgi:hypothetical protein
MISTMPKSGTAPTSPNALPGGLGAILQQPGGAPKGASPRSIGAIMERARSMSDMQLADVLAGKSLDVPQYVAMTEAMGRKSLRTATQGAQAQKQARQPSVKDRLMAEEAQAMQMAQAPQGGIDQLPAPNMGSVDMASGGIIAFQDRGLVEEDLTSYYDRMKQRMRKATEGATTVPSMPTFFGIPLVGAADKKALAKEEAPAAAPAAALPPVDNSNLKPDDKGRFIANADAPVPTSGPAGGGSAGRSGIAALAPDGYEELQKKRTSDYLSKLEGLSEKQRAGIAQIKKEGSGEALLQLGSALMGSRNLAEAGAKAGQQLASTASATRREIRGVENLANEYDLNLAKAQEAAEKGDMALALQYKQLADQAKYQQGMLAVHGQRNALMGQGNNLAKVSTALLNIDKQALNEAKEKFPMVTKGNQAAFDAFIKKRSTELKMANPLTKEYANLSAGDLGGSPRFNTVQSLPNKGASVIDLDA